MCNRSVSTEIAKLTALAESLENWLKLNKCHVDYEKMNRELKDVSNKIKSKEQTIKRATNPNKYAFKQEYSFPNNIKL